MFVNFVSSEIKKWLRDPMMSFMFFYPLFLGIIGRYVLPWLSKSTGFNFQLYTDLIVVLFATMIPMLYGALIAFSLLDDRDDHILIGIQVTPLSLWEFLSLRLVIVLLLSFIATIFTIWFANIGNLPFIRIVQISFLTSLSAPMVGLFINALAQNKIEGFAIMKATGIIIILPVISLFFTDAKEFFFALIPGFWPAKAISCLIKDKLNLPLTFIWYYLIGLVYVLFLNYLSYKMFLWKNNN